MIVFFTKYTDAPIGALQRYLGDTVRDEFLVDPATAEAVLTSIGIRREPYERAATAEEIKQLMFDDINKLKSYLSGPGATDERFKKEIRSQVGTRFNTIVMNSIKDQPWQMFTLKSDSPEEYEKMKDSLRNLKTGALYAASSFDDENMAVVIETSNTIMTLDKQKNDGSVRVVNIKGKGGRVINYSDTNPYGAIESNSNWIAGDLYTWLLESGFDSSQLITERKYELGAGSGAAKSERTPSFREGQKHALELLEQEEDSLKAAQMALADYGVLEEEPTKEDIAQVEAEEGVDETEPQVHPVDERTQSLPLDDEETTEGELPEKATEEKEVQNKEIDDIVKAGIEALVKEKMIAEAAVIKTAQDLFPEYSAAFEKFLPTSITYNQAIQKTWDDMRNLRSRGNASEIERHLKDMVLRKMFLQNQSYLKVNQEKEQLQTNNELLKKQIEALKSENTRFQEEKATANRELAIAQQEIEGLKEVNDQNEKTIMEFETDIETITAQVNGLKEERDALIPLKEENERLVAELSSKDKMITTLNETNATMTKSQELISETLNRVEKDLERISSEKQSLQSQVDNSSVVITNLKNTIASLSNENGNLIEQVEALNNRNGLSEGPQEGGKTPHETPVSEPVQETQTSDGGEGKSVSAEIADLHQMAEKAENGLVVKPRDFVQRSKLSSATDRLKNLGKNPAGPSKDPE